MNESLLSQWHANPENERAAQHQLEEVRNQLKHVQEDNYLPLRIQEISARYWLGRDISGDIDNLLATCKDDYCKALVTLIYGQLLISRKIQGSMEFLQRGFKQAANYIDAAGYLEVMRRHERLSQLPLFNKPAPAQTLNDLLIEADVIKKIKGKEKHHRDIMADNKDTVG